MLPFSMAASSARPIMASPALLNCAGVPARVPLRFRSVSIIIGSFESRFNQCDESEMNTVRRGRRCNRSLIAERPENQAFVESGQQALTVALEGAVTMRRGRAMPLPGGGVIPANAADGRPHRSRGRVPRGLFCRGRRCWRNAHRTAGIARFGPGSRDGGGYQGISVGADCGGDGGSCFADPACALRPLVLTVGRRRGGPSGNSQTAAGSEPGPIARREQTRESGNARRRREFRGPEFHQQRLLTTPCEFPHLVPKSASHGRSNLHWRQSALAPGSFKPQSRRRPPSPTPASPPTASL
jgi:hypothetical protein